MLMKKVKSKRKAKVDEDLATVTSCHFDLQVNIIFIIQ